MGAPSVGHVEDGYEFRGGDASKKENWKPVEAKVPAKGTVDGNYIFKGGDPANQDNWDQIYQDDAPKPQPAIEKPSLLKTIGNDFKNSFTDAAANGLKSERDFIGAGSVIKNQPANNAPISQDRNLPLTGDALAMQDIQLPKTTTTAAPASQIDPGYEAKLKSATDAIIKTSPGIGRYEALKLASKNLRDEQRATEHAAIIDDLHARLNPEKYADEKPMVGGRQSALTRREIADAAQTGQNIGGSNTSSFGTGVDMFLTNLSSGVGEASSKIARTVSPELGDITERSAERSKIIGGEIANAYKQGLATKPFSQVSKDQLLDWSTIQIATNVGNIAAYASKKAVAPYLGVIGAQTFGDALRTGEENGLSPTVNYTQAISKAASEVGVELIPFEVADHFKHAALTASFKQEFMKRMMAYAGMGVSIPASEGGEEVLTNLFDSVIDRVVADQGSTPKATKEKLRQGGLLDGSLDAFAAGAIAGGPGAAVAIPATMYQAGSDPVRNRITQLIDSGKLSGLSSGDLGLKIKQAQKNGWNDVADALDNELRSRVAKPSNQEIATSVMGAETLDDAIAASTAILDQHTTANEHLKEATNGFNEYDNVSDDALANALSEEIPATTGDENVSQPDTTSELATRALDAQSNIAEGGGANTDVGSGSGLLSAGPVNINRGNGTGNSGDRNAGNGSAAQDSTIAPVNVAGDPINDEWHAFSPESGSLNIPRDTMPQIKAEARGAMTQFLKARDITHEQDEVPAGELKPTQMEYSPTKVEKALGFEGNDRSILISSDNHVLDGHHQWLAKLSKNEIVPVIRLNAPIKDLLEVVKEFPSATVDESSLSQPETATAPEAKAEEPLAITAPKVSQEKPNVTLPAESPVSADQVGGVSDMVKPADNQVTVARIGGKNSGERISVQRAGDKLNVFYNGEPLIDFDSEQEVTVPATATIDDIKKAVKASGQFNGKIVTFDNAYVPQVEAEKPAEAVEPKPKVKADSNDTKDQVASPGNMVDQSADTGKAIDQSTDSKITDFVQLKPSTDGDYYTINTAFPVSDNYAEKKEGWSSLWSRYPVSADESGSSDFVDNAPNAGGAAPMVKSQSGNTSVRQPKAESNNDKDIALNQPKAQYNGYETDLFGNPLSAATTSKGDSNSEPDRSISESDSEFYAEAIAGSEQTKRLGAPLVRNAAEAARATQYLYKSAVERFDAIVTDDSGKPLAVVGGFKGAIAQTQVYPSTLISEAIAVKGGTRLWLSHNHPSGSAELSKADVALYRNVEELMRGSGVEVQGIIAVAGNQYSAATKQGDESGDIKPSTVGRKVPVVERELVDKRNNYSQITGPDSAKLYAKSFYDKAKSPGILMLDAQNRISAWVPIPEVMRGPLRDTGGLNAVYQAISRANPRAAVIVHGGEIDGDVVPGVRGSIANNIAQALLGVDVSVLDIINTAKNTAASEGYERIGASTMFSRIDSTSGMEVEDVDRAVKAITKGWENAPSIIVVQDMNDTRIPKRVRDDNERQLSQGADGSPAGFFDSGKVYVVATEMNSVDQIVEVVFHETLGHYGMRGVFGNSIRSVLNDVYLARRSDVLKKAKEYGLDINVRDERLLAAEEVLAEMAQTNPQIGFVKRAIAAIRTWLRDNVPYFKNLELTDAEIIRNILEPARNFVVSSQQSQGEGAMATAFQRTNRKPSRADGDTYLTAALEYLARDPELFQQPSSDSKAISDIAKDINTAYVALPMSKGAITNFFTQKDRPELRAWMPDRAWTISVPDSPHRQGMIFVKGDKVWIDVSKLQSGIDGGNVIYGIAAAYAHNNGKKLIGDPAGLSRQAFYRRNENMLSSALKYGTTRHLQPHDAQISPIQEFGNTERARGMRKLDWIEGDDVHNIRELMYNSWKSAVDNVPELKDVIYNPESREFEYTDGRPFTAKDSERIATGLAGQQNNPYRAGSATQKRAALFNTFLRKESGQRGRQLLGALVDQLSRDGLSPSLKDVMYSRTKPNQGISKQALLKMGKRMSGGSSTSPGGTELTSLLNLFDTNQLVEMYSEALPELLVYKELKNVEVANRNLLMDHADKLLNKLRKMPESQRDTFANIAHEATIEQVDPTKAYRDTPAIKQLRDMVESLETKKDPLTPKAAELLRASKNRLAAKKSKHAELRNQFLAMSDESQALFLELKNTYAETAERVFNEVQNRIDRMGIDSKSKAKVIAELRQEFDQVKQSVYFPLARFGDNVLIGTKDVNGVPERVVEYYEKESLAKAAELRMQEDGYKTKITSRKAAQQDNKAIESIADIIANIKEMKQPGEEADLSTLLDHVNQALIQMLPDQSYRRHFMHRKNVPGYSTDFIRAYSDSMWKSANHISGLMHGDRITKTIGDMQKRIDATDSGNVAAAQDVVNNLIKREELQNLPTSPVAALAGQFGFVSALGSASNFLLNLTQTPMLTFPWLGARYGFTKASLELSKALTQTVRSMEKASTLDEVAQVFDIRKQIKGDELAAMELVYHYGKIDLTQAYDLIDAANKNSADYDGKMQKLMRFAALPQHLSENINRQVSALATIRLALKDGLSPKLAAMTAMTVLDETHFNYEKWNRPPAMQGNVQRVLFMFKQYAQKVAYLYTKLALTAATKPEERKVAIKQLAAMFAMQAGLGGILSLPIYGEAMVIGSGVAGYKIGGKKGAYAGVALGLFLAMLSAMRDDDDKEEFDTAVRNFMSDKLGKTVGEALTRGLPRLFGVDISGRVDASELILRRPNASEPIDEKIMSYVNGMLGYAYGYATQFAYGASLIASGEFSRGADKMLPAKQLRDLFKAYRYETEGATNKSGDVLVPDVTPAESITQAIGFTPARIADRYEANSAIKYKQTLINDEKKKITDKAWSEYRKNQEVSQETIDEATTFNDKYAEDGFQLDLASSILSKVKSDMNTVSGIYVPRKQRSLLETGRFANDK